jgi:hypothetical protein
MVELAVRLCWRTAAHRRDCSYQTRPRQTGRASKYPTCVLAGCSIAPKYATNFLILRDQTNVQQRPRLCGTRWRAPQKGERKRYSFCTWDRHHKQRYTSQYSHCSILSLGIYQLGLVPCLWLPTTMDRNPRWPHSVPARRRVEGHLQGETPAILYFDRD